MRQPRRTTDFAGWQSHLDYLAYEAEREKREQATIALYQREREQERMPVVSGKWMLCLAVTCLICFGFLCWYIHQSLQVRP